jgi:hypothetical protein
MKRPDLTELALDQLREASDVRPFLKNRSARVVAKAAEKAVRLSAATSAPELVEAFRRFLENGAKQDPGCAAKLAIAKALVELEDPAAEVYFSGSRYVQMEPVWGESIDTAAELRGICIIGLVRMAHPEGLLEAARLLNDKAPESRIGALRALADSGKAEAELLLRFKAGCGDKRPEVEGECFAALLRIGPRARAVPFVAEFLARGSEEAAIALGESRIPEAWPVLRDAFPGSAVTSAVLLGISLLRHDEAIQFLIQRIEKDRERVAASAIEALASYRGDKAIRERVEQIVEGRSGVLIRKAFQTYFC